MEITRNVLGSEFEAVFPRPIIISQDLVHHLSALGKRGPDLVAVHRLGRGGAIVSGQQGDALYGDAIRGQDRYEGVPPLSRGTQSSPSRLPSWTRRWFVAPAATPATSAAPRPGCDRAWPVTDAVLGRGSSVAR